MTDINKLKESLSNYVCRGNGIERSALQVLSTILRTEVASNPAILVQALGSVVCEVGVSFIATRILLIIHTGLHTLDSEQLSAIRDRIRYMLFTIDQPRLVVASIHNAVFMLPVQALDKNDVTGIGEKIVGFVEEIGENEELSVNISSMLAHFMKKWGRMDTPEVPIIPLLGAMSCSRLSYSVLNHLCTAAAYLILAIIEDENEPLAALIDNVVDGKPTVMDRCTSVSGVPFRDYVLHTMTRAVQFQLIASVLLCMNDDQLKQVSGKFTLLQKGLEDVPRDERGLTCFYTMMSAVLKVSARQITPKALHMCSLALVTYPHPRDNVSRRAIHACMTSILQCTTLIVDAEGRKSFNDNLFQRIIMLEEKSVFRTDALPVMIPVLSFERITLDFFRYLVSLLDSHKRLGIVCIFEVYKAFPVPLEYSTVLIEKLCQMSSVRRVAVLKHLVESGLGTMQRIQEHVQQMEGISAGQRLDILVSLGTLGARKTCLPIGLLRDAIHSLDFDLRLHGIDLMCTRRSLDDEMLPILLEAIPRAFVYCDRIHHRSLLKVLGGLMNKFSGEKMNKFLEALVEEMILLLRRDKSGDATSYVLKLLKTIWRRQPLFLLSMDVMEQLIFSLFNPRYHIRDETFQALLLIMSRAEDNYKKNLVSAVFKPDNDLIKGPIERYKRSEQLRKGDGAACLMALLNCRCEAASRDAIISDMHKEFDVSTGTTIQSYFPLSVVLRVMQSWVDSPIEIAIRLIPSILNVITDSMVSLSVDENVEFMPVHSVMDVNSESQVQVNAAKSLLVVHEALNIISCFVNRHPTDLSPELMKDIGTTVLNLLLESHSESAVRYAQRTFQVVCARCFIRTNDDCITFPMQWCDALINAADTFTWKDHYSCGFVQTAMALIHAEPFQPPAGKREICSKLLKMCNLIIDHPGPDNELLSALLLMEAIASDPRSQLDFEAFALRSLMTVLRSHVEIEPSKTEILKASRKCIATFLARYSLNKGEVGTIDSKAFFNEVAQIMSFFHEHLNVDKPAMTCIILQIIELMQPFRDVPLMLKILELSGCREIRVRMLAARCILIVMPFERAEESIRRAIRGLRLIPDDETERAPVCDPEIPIDEIMTVSSRSERDEKCSANTVDGTILQVRSMIGRFPAVRETMKSEIESMCAKFIEIGSSCHMKIYAIAMIAREFDCLNILNPLLRTLFHMSESLKKVPFGHRLLRSSFSALEEGDILRLLQSDDEPAIVHFLLQVKEMSTDVQSACIDIYLESNSARVTEIVHSILMTKAISPNAAQRERFRDILLATTSDVRLEMMLVLAPRFLETAKPIFRHFERFSGFDAKSDSAIMTGLSNLALHFHDELFSTFDADDCVQWKIALRIVSDGDSTVRLMCCKALSRHYSRGGAPTGLDVCEFDLVHWIYDTFARGSSEVMREHLEYMNDIIDSDSEVESPEPAGFLLPPVFHVKCIKRKLKSCR